MKTTLATFYFNKSSNYIFFSSNNIGLDRVYTMGHLHEAVTWYKMASYAVGHPEQRKFTLGR